MTTSIIRTLVPIVYALLIRLGMKNWLGVDEEALLDLVTAAVTTAVYAAIRFVESHVKEFGWLLGAAKEPTYPE